VINRPEHLVRMSYYFIFFERASMELLFYLAILIDIE